MTDRVGQQLGNYRLTRLLGQGGFAEVYLGEHIYLGTEAAIKVLTMRLTGYELEQFRNEARTIARLKHPHIVRILDFGVEGTTPFLVMEYAPSGTLRQHYTEKPLPSPASVVPIVMQIATALQHAHDQKLIHRDVKPENMLLESDNHILLSDFGLAVAAHSTRSLSTQTSAGTVYYMSPEQIHGKPRPATDQYALGIVVYEWLCGTRPFEGTSWQVLSQHLTTPPPPLREKVPNIPQAVEQVILKALAKDPHQRFASMLEFAKALEAACQEKPVPKRPTLGTLILTYKGHSSPVRGIAWSPDGKHIVSGGDDKTVHVWNAVTGNRLLTCSGHSDWVWSVAWSPDSTHIASSSDDRTVKIWDARTGRELLTYSRHSSWVRAVAWSPDNSRIASASNDKTVQVWSATNGSHLFTYRDHASNVHTVTWSPNGTYIASGGNDKIVRVWDAGTGRTILSYHGHSDKVWAVSWSPDGKYIASGSSDKTIQVWDAIIGRIVLTCSGHSDTIYSVSWSSDCRYIASGSDDGTVRIWNASSGDHAFTYRGHSGFVVPMAWSPDGERIASGGQDGTVQIWQAR